MLARPLIQPKSCDVLNPGGRRPNGRRGEAQIPEGEEARKSLEFLMDSAARGFVKLIARKSGSLKINILCKQVNCGLSLFVNDHQ